MRHVDTAQRRARLARRHHLAEPAPDLLTVAEDLCGIHSTDAASVMLGARARVRDFVPADAERLLYADRDLARVLAMRRTLFVVPTDRVPSLQAATVQAQVAGQRRRNIALLADGGNLPDTTDVAAWLDDVADRTVAALEARGEATATELKDDVPELDERITVGRGRRWGGEVGVSTRVLFLLATQGRVVRGRPRGSWVSTQYRWAATSRWFGDRVDLDADDAAPARARLAAWWLRAHGPAAVDDLQWWAGWTKRDTRAAVAAIDPVEVELDTGAGIDAEAAGLAAWLGDVRVTPRFRTPLEKELST